MRYFLKKDVVVAYGAMGSCIYDLRDFFAKIYRLDQEASDFVKNITTQNDFPIEEEHNFLLSELLSNAFLIRGHEVCTKDEEKHQNKNLTAWIEVTEKCQLRCSYCYGSFDAKKTNKLNAKDIDLIIDQLICNGFSNFKLIGGEPLLCKDIVQTLVSRLSEIKGCNIELFTNGLLLTEDFLAFCVKHDVKIAIGIFGANDTECLDITGASNVFKKQSEIIKLVKNSGVTYRLSITRTEQNSSASKEKLADIYEFPVALLRQDQVKHVGRAGSLPNHSLLQPKRIQESHFKRKFKSSFIKSNMYDGHPCYKDKICITSSLDVYPCIMERTVVYGNLADATLVDILKSGSASACMKVSKDYIDTCKDCEYRYACFDCRVDRESPMNFYSKSLNCSYNPHKGTWAK